MKQAFMRHTFLTLTYDSFNIMRCEKKNNKIITTFKQITILIPVILVDLSVWLYTVIDTLRFRKCHLFGHPHSIDELYKIALHNLAKDMRIYHSFHGSLYWLLLKPMNSTLRGKNAAQFNWMA